MTNTPMAPKGNTQIAPRCIPAQTVTPAARRGAVTTVNLKERLYLLQNAVEGTGLDPRLRFDGVAVHGIAGPHHLRAFATDHANEPRQLLRNSVGAEAADQREAARPVLR